MTISVLINITIALASLMLLMGISGDIMNLKFKTARKNNRLVPSSMPITPFLLNWGGILLLCLAAFLLKLAIIYILLLLLVGSLLLLIFHFFCL